jgi:hypothetical protein
LVAKMYSSNNMSISGPLPRIIHGLVKLLLHFAYLRNLWALCITHAHAEPPKRGRFLSASFPPATALPPSMLPFCSGAATSLTSSFSATSPLVFRPARASSPSKSRPPARTQPHIFGRRTLPRWRRCQIEVGVPHSRRPIHTGGSRQERLRLRGCSGTGESKISPLPRCCSISDL